MFSQLFSLRVSSLHSLNLVRNAERGEPCRLRGALLSWAVGGLLSLGMGGTSYADSKDPSGDFLRCGAEEVFLVNPRKPSITKWSWRAEHSPSLSKEARAWFHATDDCKPYEGGLLVITASTGGVAMIDRESKKCLFLAQESPNAHSACLLPKNRLVVASSYGTDEMQFFDLADNNKSSTAVASTTAAPTLAPSPPVQTIPLVGAHGAIWDGDRNCLWALGGEELLKLVVTENAAPEGRWSVDFRLPLPSSGGHDLSPTRDGTHLFVTTDTQVLLFDRNTKTFLPHPQLGDLLKIKSVDVHPVTKKIVYHKATQEHWWSDTVRFVGSDPLEFEGERLYKIRWDSPAPRP